jgi:hypothetical protein
MSLLKKLSTLALLGLLISTSVYAVSDTKESAGQYMDNSVLTAKVKAAIFNEPTLKS